MHMPVEALFAAVGHLHRSPGSQGQQAQMHVEAEVLTGTERTTNPGQRQADLVLGQAETGCHLVAVLVQPLGSHIKVDATILIGDGQPGLRTEEGLILHAYLVGPLNRYQVVSVCSRLVTVTEMDPANDVPVGMDRGGVGSQLWVHQRFGRFPVHLDCGEGTTHRVGMVGGHYDNGLALVADDVGGQNRLVPLDKAIGGATWHVLVGQHGVHTGKGQRRSYVDAPDPRRGVRRPEGATPEHPVMVEVAGKSEGSGHLGHAIGAGRTLADSRSGGRAAGDLQGGHGVTSLRRADAARSTASRIRP